jgi:hypothetical protein
MSLDQGRSECPIHGESFAQHFGNCTNETDENDSDEILTRGGLLTKVIERELPFALIT